MSTVGTPSVMQTMSLQPASAASYDGAGRAEGRHEDDGRVHALLLDRFFDRVVDGDLVLELLAAAARGDAGHDLGAVFQHLPWSGIRRHGP